MRRRMPLTIRIPKTHPELNRRAAVEMAQEIAEVVSQEPHELRRANDRMEQVDGAVLWEYVVEFPDA